MQADWSTPGDGQFNVRVEPGATIYV
jgi:hypothetical protein